MIEKKAKGSNFLFSVIVPIFNMEEYLGEAIESVISQTIGFKDNIQLILVDDGSVDSSLRICKQYEERFPDNIVVLHQENRGVGAARNLGLRYAEGRYIAFLDPDDKWDSRAFDACKDFFQKNPRVGILAARILHFGRWSGPHALDYKFAKTRIVNIFDEWDCPQLSTPTAFFRHSLLEGRNFNSLKTSEDFIYVSSLVLELGVYGVSREAVYCYRKREDQSSAIDTAKLSRSYYDDVFTHCYMELFKRSQELYGYVTPYAQYAVMYDLQWRIAESDPGVLSSTEKEAYKTRIVQLLQDISEKVICKQRHMGVQHKLYTLSLKWGVSYEVAQSALQLGDSRYSSVAIGSGANLSENSVKIEFIEVLDNAIVFEGCIQTVFSKKDVALVLLGRGTEIVADLFERSDLSTSSYFDDTFTCGIGFKVALPRAKSAMISFALKHRGEARKTKITYGRFCKLSRIVKNYYFYENDCVLVSRKNHSIQISEHPSKKLLVKRELSLDLQIAKKKQLKGLSIIVRRAAVLLARAMENKGSEIWIVSDRIRSADDNGESFFSYIASNPIEHVNSYYAIAKDSKDFSRLQTIGNVVDFGSKRYKWLFLQSSFIVSSSFDAHVYRQFGRNEDYFKNLYRFRYVFLQHGVTKDDMSRSLNRFNKNISLFVTSAKREYESILECPYYYDADKVILSGFPRHDALIRGALPKGKKIIIMPTWRNSLVSGFAKGSNAAILDKRIFIASEYYQRYSSLLANEDLLQFLRENDYTIDFVIHPGFAEMTDTFKSNDVVRVVRECCYRDEFQESSLMITDYSSVAFDFAILKRPIIYYQFDKDLVLGGEHIYSKGYFSYENDGFGPVIDEESSLVRQIKETIAGGCQMESLYADRASSFFYTPDESVSRSQLIRDRMLEMNR